jgi:hypothetical protein
MAAVSALSDACSVLTLTVEPGLAAYHVKRRDWRYPIAPTTSSYFNFSSSKDLVMDHFNAIFNFVPLWTIGPLFLVGVVAWLTTPTTRRRD